MPCRIKYTENLNDQAIVQLLAYGWIHQREQNLNDADINLFLLLSHTPRQATLEDIGYNETDEQGVYASDNGVYQKIIILSLNDLVDTPNNIPLKCFAGKKVEQVKAFEAVGDKYLEGMSFELEHVFAGLRELLIKKGLDMNTAETEELTPEYVEQLGKKMIEMFAEERLKQMSADDVIHTLPKDELQKLKDKLNKM